MLMILSMIKTLKNKINSFHRRQLRYAENGLFTLMAARQTLGAERYSRKNIPFLLNPIFRWSPIRIVRRAHPWLSLFRGPDELSLTGR